MGDRLWADKLPQYFTKPARPTQPPTLSGTGNENHGAMTGHSTSVLVPCSCSGFRPSAITETGRSSPLLFSPCLLWPNGRPSQLLLSAELCWFIAADAAFKEIGFYILCYNVGS